MKSSIFISLVTSLCLPFVVDCTGQSIERIRGIPLEMKALYDPSKAFKCIDGSMSLPFSYVNDDYCDCPDGSDEPGTSACPRTKFHCINLLHSPLNIPSSRVNDGICDCCDGSDEYATNANCPNTCEMLGRAAREEAKRREELISEGSKLRKSMVDEGKQKVTEAKVKVEELKVVVEGAKQFKESKDELRKQAEEVERKLLDEEAALKKDKESTEKPAEYVDENDGGKAEVENYVAKDETKAREVFQLLDADVDGLLTIEEITKIKKFDQNLDGVVSNDEAKFFLAYRDEVDEDEFVSTAWPLIKPIYMLAQTEEERRKAFSVLPEETQESSDELNDEHNSEDYEEVEAPPAPTPTSEEPRDPAVQAAVSAADIARTEYHDSERKHKDAEQELEKFQQIIDGDFGDEAEFVPLRGECFEMFEKEYVYKICPFDKCSQRSKDGGSETSLGRWGHWEQIRGNKYAAMKFEGGTGCWNGPARSTLVVLQCGLSNQLISATEPSRCEYQFEFATPAACTTGMPVANQSSGGDHDEL